MWYERLVFKLIGFGFPFFILKILKSFINRITFKVKINSSTSTTQPIMAGVPQDSILERVVFNLYMSDIPLPETASLAPYADDLLSYANTLTSMKPHTPYSCL